jgi:acyl-CoA hydrolase
MVEDERIWQQNDVNFHTRKWVRPEDLNANGSLFGGSLLRWIDEEAAIYAIIQLGNHHVVTKYLSEINFESSAQQGDLLELGLVATRFGRTSITMRAVVRNMITRRTILSIDKIVFVNIGPDGKPKEHGYSTITYRRDRMPTTHTDQIPLPSGNPVERTHDFDSSRGGSARG